MAPVALDAVPQTVAPRDLRICREQVRLTADNGLGQEDNARAAPSGFPCIVPRVRRPDPHIPAARSLVGTPTCSSAASLSSNEASVVISCGAGSSRR